MPAYIGTQIHAVDVDESPAVQARVFTLDTGRAVFDVDMRHISQGDTLPRRGHDRQQRQLLRRVAVFLRIAHIDRVALQPLDGLGDVHPAHSTGHDLLDIGNIEAVTRRITSLNIHLNVAPAATRSEYTDAVPGTSLRMVSSCWPIA